ncbi:unannotated protein [freshwater metagenome]|uniref:Unannotated protein n=1 Tax=freshwater metagenome TaxID=449393 RepID=A0A6J7HMI4_9ZZZZ
MDSGVNPRLVNVASTIATDVGPHPAGPIVEDP